MALGILLVVLIVLFQVYFSSKTFISFCSKDLFPLKLATRSFHKKMLCSTLLPERYCHNSVLDC
jgi:hypothetical protein